MEMRTAMGTNGNSITKATHNDNNLKRTDETRTKPNTKMGTAIKIEEVLQLNQLMAMENSLKNRNGDHNWNN